MVAGHVAARCPNDNPGYPLGWPPTTPRSVGCTVFAESVLHLARADEVSPLAPEVSVAN